MKLGITTGYFKRYNLNWTCKLMRNRSKSRVFSLKENQQTWLVYQPIEAQQANIFSLKMHACTAL